MKFSFAKEVYVRADKALPELPGPRVLLGDIEICGKSPIAVRRHRRMQAGQVNIAKVSTDVVVNFDDNFLG